MENKIKVTSDVPSFALSQGTLEELAAWASGAGAIAVHLTTWGRAVATLADGSERDARYQPGLRGYWTWADEYMPG